MNNTYPVATLRAVSARTKGYTGPDVVGACQREQINPQALTPSPSPKKGRGEQDFRFPFSHNWEKGLGDDSEAARSAGTALVTCSRCGCHPMRESH